MTALSVSITCMLVLAGTLLAAAGDEPADGPKVIFRDDFIDNLARNWTITRQIRGKEVHNTMTAQWVLNHQFLQLHMKDTADPPQYEAIILIGYAHADQQYIIHWCDVFGGKFSARGKGKRSGNSIEFKFDYDDGPFFNTFTWDENARTWTFKMESQDKDGKRALFATDTLRRS
jgi:hypothetical protein